jgi:CheY-like chemotaxis protein
MPGGAAITVLLVENEERDFDATARRLRDAGLQVLHATTAIDALDVLGGTRKIDALVVAARLPGQPSGFTIARMGRRKRPHLPVLYLGGGDVPPEEAARALGPVLDPGANLAAAVRAALDPEKGAAREGMR